MFEKKQKEEEAKEEIEEAKVPLLDPIVYEQA
jgi:hypothetical protein